MKLKLDNEQYHLSDEALSELRDKVLDALSALYEKQSFETRLLIKGFVRAGLMRSSFAQEIAKEDDDIFMALMKFLMKALIEVSHDYSIQLTSGESQSNIIAIELKSEGQSW